MKTQWEGGIRLLTIPKGQQALFSRSEPCWAVTGSDRQRGLRADVARGPSGPARPQARRGGSRAPSRGGGGAGGAACCRETSPPLTAGVSAMD